jgi:hypothetical protein
MKKFLTVLGVIFLVVLVLGIAGFIYLASRGAALDKEARPSSTPPSPMVVKDWDQETFLKYASPEFLQATKGEDLTRLFKTFRRLGQMLEYQGSQGQANMFYMPRTGKQITGVYVAKAKFDAGPAQIKVTAIKGSAVADRRLSRSFALIPSA